MQLNADAVIALLTATWLTFVIIFDGYKTRREIKSLRGDIAAATKRDVDLGGNLTARLTAFQGQKFGPRFVGGCDL